MFLWLNDAIDICPTADNYTVVIEWPVTFVDDPVQFPKYVKMEEHKELFCPQCYETLSIIQLNPYRTWQKMSSAHRSSLLATTSHIELSLRP
jgi:hypothetical protein